MINNESKKTFYPKVEEAFLSKGYKYYDGDRDIRGKTRSHASKPDYIAIIGDVIIIGEIKSQMEGPTSSSWRQIQNSDSEGYKTVRNEVTAREKAGVLPKEVGGHEIIVRGQIPDYMTKLNKTYDLPSGVSESRTIKGGYSVPSAQENHVEVALKNCKKTSYEKIDINNGSVTYIFSL